MGPKTPQIWRQSGSYYSICIGQCILQKVQLYPGLEHITAAKSQGDKVLGSSYDLCIWKKSDTSKNQTQMLRVMGYRLRERAEPLREAWHANLHNKELMHTPCRGLMLSRADVKDWTKETICSAQKEGILLVLENLSPETLSINYLHRHRHQWW